MDSEAFRVKNKIEYLIVVDFVDGKFCAEYQSGIEEIEDNVLKYFSREGQYDHFYERNWTDRAKLAYSMLK